MWLLAMRLALAPYGQVASQQQSGQSGMPVEAKQRLAGKPPPFRSKSWITVPCLAFALPCLFLALSAGAGLTKRCSASLSSLGNQYY